MIIQRKADPARHALDVANDNSRPVETCLGCAGCKGLCIALVDVMTVPDIILAKSKA